LSVSKGSMLTPLILWFHSIVSKETIPGKISLLPPANPAGAPIDVFDRHYPGGVWEGDTAFSNRLKTLDIKTQVQLVTGI
jgi:hypothetical protein